MSVLCTSLSPRAVHPACHLFFLLTSDSHVIYFLFICSLYLSLSLSLYVTGRNKILRIRLKTLLHSRSSQGHRHLVHPMNKRLKKLPPQQQVETAAKICGPSHKQLPKKCGSEDKEFYPLRKNEEKTKSLYPLSI